MAHARRLWKHLTGEAAAGGGGRGCGGGPGARSWLAGSGLPWHNPPAGRRRRAGGQGQGGTYGDAVAEAGARLRAGGAYVIPHSGVLAGRAVEVGDGSWAVGPREASGPRRVGACRGSGPAKIRLSTVAIQDWCAENRAGYEAGSQACTGHHKPDTREEQLRPDF